MLRMRRLALGCTAKIQYRKFETNIPSKGLARPQSQFPNSFVCERFIYSHDRSAYFFAGKYEDRYWEYINRSQTHGCWNWDWGSSVPFLGKHKWDFRCSVGWKTQVSKSQEIGSLKIPKGAWRGYTAEANPKSLARGWSRLWHRG